MVQLPECFDDNKKYEGNRRRVNDVKSSCNKFKENKNIIIIVQPTDPAKALLDYKYTKSIMSCTLLMFTCRMHHS